MYVCYVDALYVSIIWIVNYTASISRQQVCYESNCTCMLYLIAGGYCSRIQEFCKDLTCATRDHGREVTGLTRASTSAPPSLSASPCLVDTKGCWGGWLGGGPSLLQPGNQVMMSNFPQHTVSRTFLKQTTLIFQYSLLLAYELTVK